jgi:hypothetical protein
MNRRTLLATTILAPVVAVLAGCNGQTAAQIAQTVVTDVGNVANAALSVAPLLLGVPAPTLSEIETYASDISTLAGEITTAMAQTDGQPILSKINTYVTDLADDAKPYVAAGSTGATILSDIQTLMPVILAGVGILLAGSASDVDVSAARARLAALPRVK